MRLTPSIAVPCLALIRCVSEAARCATHGAHGPPPSLFSAPCACYISSNCKRLVCVSALSPPCRRMSSDTFWSDACKNAANRPLPTVLEALYASCGVTVRRPPLLPLGA